MAVKASLNKVAIVLLATLAAMPTSGSSKDPLVMQHPSMPHTEFHLFVGHRQDSQQASEAFCRQRQLTAVSTREVRYFWKQLPYNISFYLGSRIEMTTDHPEIERGEVLCFPLRRINVPGGPSAAYDALHAIHKSSGSGSSCRASVTSVLCKRQPSGIGGNCTVDQLLQPGLLIPSQQGQQQQQQQQPKEQGQVTFKTADGSFCMSSPLFWTMAAGTGSLLLLLTVASVTLAACSIRFKRQLNRSGSFGYRCLSRQASARLMMQANAGKHPIGGGGGGSHVSGAALDTEDGGGFFL